MPSDLKNGQKILINIISEDDKENSYPRAGERTRNGRRKKGFQEKRVFRDVTSRYVRPEVKIAMHS